MNRKSDRQSREDEGMYLRVPVPITGDGVFSHSATGPVLDLLIDNPGTAFTNRELRRLTGKGMGNVNGAVEALETLGVVAVDRDGRANQVSIEATKLHTPEDSISAIPQAEFHDPVRAVVDQLTERLDTDVGVVLFGSVARGEADRASDVDLFVVVEDDRMAAQREAHAIEDEVASRRFSGDRYEFHIVVETRDSSVRRDGMREILVEGLTLRDSPALAAVKEEVFGDGT